MASAPMRRSCELVPCRSSSIRKSTGGASPARRMISAEPRDLGVEPRHARLQRVLDADRRADLERRQPQPPRAHRRPRLRQHGVDAHRAQQRALAGHVRAAHDEHAQLAGQAHVVADRDGLREERMAQPFAVEAGRPGAQLGKDVVRMLVVVAGQRRQRLHLPDGHQPAPHRRSRRAAPALDGVDEVQIPQQQRPDQPDEDVVARIHEIHQRVQPRDAARRRLALDVELGAQRGQTRRRESVPLRAGRARRPAARDRGPPRPRRGRWRRSAPWKRQTTAPQTANERQDVEAQGRQRVRVELAARRATPRARRAGRATASAPAAESGQTHAGSAGRMRAAPAVRPTPRAPRRARPCVRPRPAPPGLRAGRCAARAPRPPPGAPARPPAPPAPSARPPASPRRSGCARVLSSSKSDAGPNRSRSRAYRCSSSRKRSPVSPPVPAHRPSSRASARS